MPVCLLIAFMMSSNGAFVILSVIRGMSMVSCNNPLTVAACVSRDEKNVNNPNATPKNSFTMFICLDTWNNFSNFVSANSVLLVEAALRKISISPLERQFCRTYVGLWLKACPSVDALFSLWFLLGDDVPPFGLCDNAFIQNRLQEFEDVLDVLGFLV